MMPAAILVAALVVIALLLSFFGARAALFLTAQRAILKTKPNGAETPADVGLEYEDFRIQSGARQLQAWWVKASPVNDLRKAVLVCHGNNESISEWIPVQHLLWRHGISSLVFDYSGFGNSSGKASVRALREDVIAACQAFEAKAGADVNCYLLGLSLGTGFLLEAVTRLTLTVAGVILIAVYSSARDFVLLKGMLPRLLVPIFPDVYNNVARIRLVHAPLLIVHSTSDELFPLAMAQQVYAAGNEPKRLALVDGLKHNAMLEGGASDYLAPVFACLKE